MSTGDDRLDAARDDLDDDPLELQRRVRIAAAWTAGVTALYALSPRGRWLALRAAGFGLFGVGLAKIFLFDLSQLSSSRGPCRSSPWAPCC